MTINRFRAAAGVLIVFNIIGTVLTWAAHLQKSTQGVGHAVAQGTPFTGPLVLVGLAIIALATSFSAPRWPARLGIFLIGLWGVGFAVGEVSELFQHNVGISATRWDVVLAAAVIGAAIGVTTGVLAVGPLKKWPSRSDTRVAAPAARV